MTYYGSNYSVLHAWVNEESESGRNGNESIWFEDLDAVYSYGKHFPLAVRLESGKFLVNGDKYSVTTSQHQSELFSIVPNSRRVEVSFSALREIDDSIGTTGWHSGYLIENIGKIKIVDYTADDYVDTGRLDKYGDPVYEHVLGAALLEYDGRQFYSGIDETGNGHQYFLTELVDRDLNTVNEGLESMKPDLVKEIEELEHDEFTGTVKRQGEWFFAELTDDWDLEIGARFKGSEWKPQKRYYLKSDSDTGTGHHYATRGFELGNDQYVKGTVRHEEGEHEMLRLYDGVKVPSYKRKWWMAVENRQVQSWSINGDID